jgi:predicted permease
MFKDLKHALRVLLQKKVWTAVVVLSLALGIGANTALFSAVNGLLLQRVPVPDPESLVRLKWAGANDMVRNTNEYGFNNQDRGENVTSTFSYDMFQKLRAANQTMTDVAAAAPQGSLNLVVDGTADLASFAYASGNLLPMLRVRPHIGRLLQEADDQQTAPPVAVISHALWVRRFASDPKIDGRVVSMNNVPVTIVGVLPKEFTGIQRAVDTPSDVTLPISLDPRIQTGQAGRLSQPTSYWVQIIGRLKPGVTTEQIQGNLGGVFQAGAKGGMDEYQASLSEADRGLANNRRRGNAVPRLIVSSASHGIYDPDTNSTKTASILSGVVILILLLVCANVANLMLSRATERRKEVSVRLSVGATRGRLIRQLVTESLVLAGLGGALGLLVGYWLRELLPFGQNAPIDWRVLAFTGGTSAVAGLLFGVVPAFRATRVDLAGAMKENSRSVVATRSILSRVLLVVQVAISIILLVGAGLFLRTVGNLQRVDVGFNPTNLLMFRVNPQLNGYDVPRSQQLYKDVRSSLLAVPGVKAVGFATPAMLSGSRSSTQIYLQGSSQPQNIHVVTVTPEFFDAMEIKLLAGRLYTHQDDLKAPNVLVINETAAKKMFPDGRVLGRLVGNTVEKNSDTEIIGVVRDIKYNSLRDAAPPTMYRTYLQAPAQGPGRSLVALVRTATDPNERIDAVRSAVRQIDANMPVANVSTQTENIARRFSQEQLFATAYSWFGGLALVIAAVGLFGLMSYSVSRRTNEIGVRMALGASRTDVVRMVLRESMLLVAVGAVIGGVAAVAASPLVEGTLFGIAPRDTATVAGAIVVMALVALAAAYLPARRASRVDPMFALRYE